jgi:hypothetical protein
VSKPLKAVAIVAGVVALTIGTAGAFAPAGATILGASLGSVAAVASAVSAVASTVSQSMVKPPGASGTISQVMIGANMPIPYAMGRTYIGGNLIYDKSSNGPDNYDRHQVFVYTAAGPIDSMEDLQADYTTIEFTDSATAIEGAAIGFYSGYLWAMSRMGFRPDIALTAPSGRDPMTEWSSAYKLSGYAATGLTMEFDEDGERWASGIPQWGMIGKWVKVYDPRLDSTYPGGAGSHLWDQESSFAWSENPALHALTYARGRYMPGAGAAQFTDDVRVVGCGIAQASIDFPAFVELANVCDANGWTIGGAVYEGPGISKWDNLKRILAAGGAEPIWVGGTLTLKLSAPKVSLDTITADDLADGEIEYRAMPAWKDRFNSIVPRYRSEDHKWEYVQAEAVTNATYATEDGETKTDEIQFDLVQDVDQATELAAYALVNRREAGPIRLNVKPRLIGYRPGEALTIDIPEAGLVEQLAVIVGRSVDPATGSVQLTLETETATKHAYALGVTGVAPPSATVVAPEDIDTTVSTLSSTEMQTVLRGTYAKGVAVTAADAGATATATITAVVFDYPGIHGDVAPTNLPANITGLAFTTEYFLYADMDSLGDLTPTFGATTNYADAVNSSTHPTRVYLGKSITTPADGAVTPTSGTSTGGGGYAYLNSRDI